MSETCEGCNVLPPYEHRCSGSGCGCLSCRELDWLAALQRRSEEVESLFPGIIAAAEARGAALAAAQVRRMAEEVRAAEAGLPADENTYSAFFRSGWRGGLLRFLEVLPDAPDLAAEVRRIEERGAERLRSSLKAIAAKGCTVIHGGSPKGTTCLDVIAESYAKPDGSSDGYKRQIRSRKWACLPCQAKAALDGSEPRMFAADLIEGGGAE